MRGIRASLKKQNQSIKNVNQKALQSGDLQSRLRFARSDCARKSSDDGKKR